MTKWIKRKSGFGQKLILLSVDVLASKGYNSNNLLEGDN